MSTSRDEDVSALVIYKDPEPCKKVLVTKRPKNGFDGEGKSEVGGMDALLVLIRALTAYGWKPKEEMNALEAALYKTAMMDIGWREEIDRKAKNEIAKLIPDNIAIEMSLMESKLVPGFVKMHPDFQFNDSRYMSWEEGGEWEWKTSPKSRAVILADGKKSMQKVMDEWFSLKITTSPSGKERRYRRFGKCAKFIYVCYTPVQIRKFEEISRFDLRTYCIGDMVDGKYKILRQEARYHILAIAMSSPTFHDIRVYNQVNSVIPEVSSYDFTGPIEKRNWTVESMDDDVEFTLIYYRVRNVPELPYTLDDIVYRPVEYIPVKDAANGSGPMNKGPLGGGRSTAENQTTVSSVPSTSGLTQSTASPLETTNITFTRTRGNDDNFRVSIGPRNQGQFSTHGGFQQREMGSSLGRMASGGRGFEGGNVRGRESGFDRGRGRGSERGSRSNRGWGRRGDQGRDSVFSTTDIANDQVGQRVTMSEGNQSASGRNPGASGPTLVSQAISGYPRVQESYEKDQDQLFESASDAAGSDVSDEPQRTQRRIAKQVKYNKASQDRLCARIDEICRVSGHLSAKFTWAEAMRLVEKLGLEELAEWCRGGCEGPGPYERYTLEHQCQDALGNLHFRLQFEGKDEVWEIGALKGILSSINDGYRKIAQNSSRHPEDYEWMRIDNYIR